MLAGSYGVRPATSDEDRLHQEAAWYGWFADRFGWTADQVDAQPRWYTARLVGVMSVFDEVRAEQQKAAAKK